jgi:glyoxylase-like metal-dependent hydrolase (beta-lactamase superfamily II)
MTRRWSVLFLLGTMACSLASAAPSDFVLQKIGDRVWAAIVNDEGKAGGNAGFVVGDDGVVVIDTFQDPEPAADLLAAIRNITNLPIRFVVNTHYHLDHVNGNDVFAAAGAVIIAHRNARGWIRTENIKMIDSPVTAGKKARVQSIALPNLVYDSSVDLYLGTRRANVRYYPGHTGGDSVVWIPDAHVVFCGDLLWKDHIPNLIDASTPAWIKTLDAIEADYGTSTWVPGHGGIANAEDIATFKKYLVDLRATVREQQGQGKSGDALLQTILPSLKAKYGTWGFFDELAGANISDTAQELAGTKKRPALVH